MKAKGELKRREHGRQEKKRTDKQAREAGREAKNKEEKKANSERSEQGLRQPAFGSRDKA